MKITKTDGTSLPLFTVHEAHNGTVWEVRYLGHLEVSFSDENTARVYAQKKNKGIGR